MQKYRNFMALDGKTQEFSEEEVKKLVHCIIE